MLRISTHRAQGSIIYIALMLTPLLSISELIVILGGNEGLLGIDLWKIKVSKDLLILLSILVAIFSSGTRRPSISNASFIILILTMAFSIALSFFNTSIESIAAGLRWFMPFVFYLTLRSQPQDFLIDVSRLLSALLLIGIALQLYQYYFMVGIYGLNESGFSIRNPGFFLVPSSMAAYSMATLYFVARFEPLRKLRAVAFFSTLVSVVLTSSGTGLISFALFIYVYFAGGAKQRTVLILGSILAGVFAYALLPVLTNRDDVYLSPIARLEVISQVMNFSKVFYSNTFGAGTNTLINLNVDYLDTGQALIADSMIGSSLVNLGFTFLLMLMYELFIRPLDKMARFGLLYFSSFFPFFASIITFELFPVNILMFIALSDLVNAQRCAPKVLLIKDINERSVIR
jgi:hypothetical protein